LRLNRRFPLAYARDAKSTVHLDVEIDWQPAGVASHMQLHMCQNFIFAPYVSNFIRQLSRRVCAKLFYCKSFYLTNEKILSKFKNKI